MTVWSHGPDWPMPVPGEPPRVAAPETVPVFVDAVLQHPTYPLVRCSYLTIETDDPDPNWRLVLGGQSMPMLLLGLAAIISQPFRKEFFTAPQDFDDLYDRVESNERWSIESGDLWLPATMFETPAPGDAYRVGRRLFTLALRFRNGGMSLEQFRVSANDLPHDLQSSETETRAFRAWHEAVMKLPAIEKDDDGQLRDRERSDEGGR